MKTFTGPWMELCPDGFWRSGNRMSLCAGVLREYFGLNDNRIRVIAQSQPDDGTYRIIGMSRADAAGSDRKVCFQLSDGGVNFQMLTSDISAWLQTCFEAGACYVRLEQEES